MNVMAYLQEYGVVGVIFTVILSVLKYYKKQGWKKRDGVDKKKEEYSIIAYVDVIMIVVTIFFRMIYKCAIIDIVCLLSIVAFFWIILNVSGKKEYELQYATFFFENGEKLQKIDVKTIKNKWKWIVCCDSDKNIEYRVRIRDIIRIQYYKR